MPSPRKVALNIGDVGYTFRKKFDAGWFTGKVVEIRPGAARGKDRRCRYEDGDTEDLSLADLNALAKQGSSSNPSSNSRPASKRSSKKDRRPIRTLDEVWIAEQQEKQRIMLSSLNSAGRSSVSTATSTEKCGKVGKEGTKKPSAKKKSMDAGKKSSGNNLVKDKACPRKDGDITMDDEATEEDAQTTAVAVAVVVQDNPLGSGEEKSSEESGLMKRGFDAVSSRCSQEDEVSKTSSHQQTLKSNEESRSKKRGVDAVSSSCSQEDKVSKTSSHQQALKSAAEYVDCKGSSIEKVSLVNKGEQASHKGMESANPELRKPPAVDNCAITDEVANQSQAHYEANNPEVEKPLVVQVDYPQLTKAEEKSADEREPEESLSKAASSSAGIEESPQNPMVVDDMIVDQEDNIAKSDDREHPPQSRGDGVEVKTNGKSAVEKETEQSEIKSIEVKEPEKAFPESPPPASIRKTGRPLPLSKDIADEQMHDGALKPVKDGKLNSQAASLVTASDSKSDDVAYGKIAEKINAAIAATPRPHKEDPAKKKQKRSRSETPKDQAKKKQKKAPKEKAKKKQKTPHSEAPQDGSKYVSKHRQRYAPKTGSGTWTDQEEFFFRKGILICGVGKWKRVVKYVPSRSYNQIIGHAQIFKINYVDEWNEIKAIAEDLNMPFDEKMEWLTSKEEYKQFANQSEMEMPEEIKNSHSPAPADDDNSENTANHTNSPAASEPNVSNSGEDLPGVFNSSDLLNARLAQNVVFAQNAANANKLMLGGLDRPLLGLGGGLGGMPPSLLAGGGLGGLPARSSLGLSGSGEESKHIVNQSVMDKLEEKRKSSLPASGHNSQNVANHTNPPAASESNVSILGEDLPGVFNASDLLNARLAQNAAFARNAANANSLLAGSTSGMLGGLDRPLIGLGGGLGGMPPSLLAGGWLGGLPARPSLGLGGDSLLGMHNHDLFDGSGRDMLNMSLVEIEQSAQRCLESIAQQQDLLSRLGRAKRIKVMSAMLEQNHDSL